MALGIIRPPRADNKTKPALGVLGVIDCGKVPEPRKVFALACLGFLVIERTDEGPVERKAGVVVEIAACRHRVMNLLFVSADGTTVGTEPPPVPVYVRLGFPMEPSHVWLLLAQAA
jgi:hypothetical protein